MDVRLEKLKQDKEITDKKVYRAELEKYQRRLLALQQMLFQEKIGLIVVFEGMDAAGKGGAIKRMNEQLDPRGVLVHPISAPAPHELRYHYMQRFWRKLPQHGQIAIFDRSWYGRVLVERIEGYASEPEWKRAYDEINAFEKSLTDERYIMVKFWVQISKDEQLKRFEERQLDPVKRWKITDEDWRNRKKWAMYVEAAEEMLLKTDDPHAPWHVIEGNDKKYARVDILKKAVAHIETILGQMGQPLPEYELFGAK
ncbi:polyphosphate kinase 2 family protein [Domibacillus enclensis]|uniref:Polyphosphate:AMP phosphotransferase n=1 Tax=Domibacillus enclensis TaxID=1017273 RepID=A0A1N6UUL0_9BACI|nr:UDP-galactose-lipid carrier transferase [Domibacillus enclensis]OXS78628.1 UDP-galactose-lipid carrier transferase [Domibacillus enclensis]SIQ69308.1 Polyphosphate:AMP phosphotransferase [Domibacillus enclensis]